jgi:hypothetical protein
VLLRSLLMLAALLLLTAALASLVAPREPLERRRTTTVPPAVTTAPVAAAPSPPAAAPVRWAPPGDPSARAEVGDVVEITITSPVRDVAEIAQLAVDTPVEEGVDAVLRFVAEQPGRFPLVLRYARERLGVLTVEPSAS